MALNPSDLTNKYQDLLVRFVPKCYSLASRSAVCGVVATNQFSLAITGLFTGNSYTLGAMDVAGK